ncbi:MAG TPA: hypothetical protein VIO32_01485 [Candidatus Baltobacteraceae bacterium]
MMSGESKVLSFKSERAFRMWLAKNHAQSDGFLLRIFKKDSGEKTVTYDEPVDQALWLQKFTPRRPRSPWSKINTERVARLIASGEMTPGLRHLCHRLSLAARETTGDACKANETHALKPCVGFEAALLVRRSRRSAVSTSFYGLRVRAVGRNSSG